MIDAMELLVHSGRPAIRFAAAPGPGRCGPALCRLSRSAGAAPAPVSRTREQVDGVVGDLLKGRLRAEPAKTKLLETRREVQRGWRAVSEILVAEGHPDLAAQVRDFAARMPPPRTDREAIAEALLKHVRQLRPREGPTR